MAVRGGGGSCAGTDKCNVKATMKAADATMTAVAAVRAAWSLEASYATGAVTVAWRAVAA